MSETATQQRFETEQVNEPVECLGLRFPNDNARRNHFLNLLAEKLRDPEFRRTEGFPIAADEDILRLSDPPYYTACPNPWLAEFVQFHGRPYSADEPYHSEPFPLDVSESSNDSICKAHVYHTKVPYRAIMQFILHYTKPGDIVLDVFAGTGMAGVAANMCDAPSADLRGSLQELFKREGLPAPVWGRRHPVMIDLSPLATSICHGYTSPFDLDQFESAANRMLNELDHRLGWMYRTQHSDGQCGRINYIVWSEVFTCDSCSGEIVFSEVALDDSSGAVKTEFNCPHCNALVSKRSLSRVFETYFDHVNSESFRRVRRVPVLIEYSLAGHKYRKRPDTADIDLIRRIENTRPDSPFPAGPMPEMYISHVKDDLSNFGISHFSHFFLPRPIHALSTLWELARTERDPRTRQALFYLVQQCNWGMSLLARYVPTHYSQVNQYLSGVFYISSHVVDVSPWYILEGKLDRLLRAFRSMPSTRSGLISLQSSVQSVAPDNSIDYIFTDPPFGENLQYSELNWLVEKCLGVEADNRTEAVINPVQRKGLLEYQELMVRSFCQCYRVLKPGRWITIEFHNSKNSVWNAIQEALQRAGFIIADVRVLDKQRKTYKQAVQGVVKADLIISAYKPNGGLEGRFQVDAGTTDGAWDFVRTHLRNLKVTPAIQDGRAEIIAERQAYMLYDRMIAFHVQRGVVPPLSAAEFYEGLEQRFDCHDGMYFLPEQSPEYLKRRSLANEVAQLSLIVTNEASAIQWLRQQLTEKPQTFQDLQPQFHQEMRGWSKQEKVLDLRDELLPDNFICYDGSGEVPAQIHRYLSTNYHNLRNLAKDDLALQAAANDRWYVPDPRKQGDLEKLRERRLLREFDEYRASKKRIRVPRLEAVRAGFKHAWTKGDYATILEVARKIPEDVLQEDPKLLMYYDQAATRMGVE